MNVTTKDFEYMKECVIRDVLTILVEERGENLTTAFDRFYNSRTFQKLQQPETGLFFQSPRYVLSYFDAEPCQTASV